MWKTTMILILTDMSKIMLILLALISAIVNTHID